MLAGNKISTQTGIGTCIAIAGVAIYSYIKAKLEEEKQVSTNFKMLLYKFISAYLLSVYLSSCIVSLLGLSSTLTWGICILEYLQQMKTT